MPDVRFDTYYRHDDPTRLLHAFADEYPELVHVESIGQSHEGRDIWFATVTNTAMGGADARVGWVVRAAGGGTVQVTARHDRAGEKAIKLALE